MHLYIRPSYKHIYHSYISACSYNLPWQVIPPTKPIGRYHSRETGQRKIVHASYWVNVLWKECPMFDAIFLDCPISVPRQWARSFSFESLLCLFSSEWHDRAPPIIINAVFNLSSAFYELLSTFPADTIHSPDVSTMWANVADGGPALYQHWVNVSCLLWCSTNIIDIKRSTNAGLMVGQCRRRWTDGKPALLKWVMFMDVSDRRKSSSLHSYHGNAVYYSWTVKIFCFISRENLVIRHTLLVNVAKECSTAASVMMIQRRFYYLVHCPP